MSENIVLIYGKHAVIEALRKRTDVVRRLHLREDVSLEGMAKSLVSKVKKIEYFTDKKLPVGVEKNSTHQGWVAEIDLSKLLIPFKEFKSTLTPSLEAGLVVLGEVQDPHNVGAIIRSAAAFGAAAVLIPEHRGCPVTGTVIKVSAGTAFSIPLVQVGNINTALRDLKKMGYWCYGLDGGGTVSLPDERFTKPAVFVVGNESAGMRLKTHELCDTILQIPMHPRAESLNASVAAATVLYAWSVQC